MNLFDDWGCGYYRCSSPVMQCCGDLGKERIGFFMHKELHSDETSYDAYILHRIPVEASIFFMQKAQQAGKKFIIELDDDIFNIPDWITSDEYKNPKWSLKRAMDMADEIWVSTNELAESLGKHAKTHVLPNLVDYNAFMTPGEPASDPIRILWTGSMWHEKDLEQIIKPVERIMAEYGNKVQFLFWGFLPDAFADYCRIPGQNIALLKQKQIYGQRLLYLEGVNFKFYFDRLSLVRPYIGLAPLYDCKFNDSKSGIKYNEYTMAGAATIATNLPPYQTIKDSTDGLLVEPEDSEGWYKAMKTLIEDRVMRDTLAKNARTKVFEEHSWQAQGRKQVWLDAFRRITR
jgi:glycosyltransferase involved in cell wall biosynthesis